MIVLIAKGKIQKVVATEEQAFYWADLLAKDVDYYVAELKLGTFKAFTLPELRNMCEAHEVRGFKPDWTYELCAGALLNVAHDMEADTSEVWELRNRLGGDPSNPVVTPLNERQRASLLGDPNGTPAPAKRAQRSAGSATAGRPKPGTTSASIWDQADALHADVKDIPHLRGLLIKWGEEQGINPSTVRTQYNHWRRFNSL